MPAGFDPYYTWLAIPPEEQPPHLYRLLGVKPLEENLDVIETAADRQMLHLRTYQSGKHGELSQKILNEVSTAKVTLLTPAKKSAYDADLRAKLNLERQAELKKARQERPLAVAQALPAATRGSGEKGVGSGESAAAAPQFSAATSRAKPRGANNNAVLLVAASVVALVLLGVGGLAALMFLGKEEPAVAVNTNPDGVPPIDAPQTNEPESQLPPPVIPPVVPPASGDDPSTTVEEPPVVDNPPADPATTDPTTPIDDEPVEEVALIDEPEAPKKLPLPDKAARDAKRKEILAIFPVAQARTFEEKGQYVAQLIRTAGESADDPAAQFALLNLAREQAAESGQIKLALEATDMLGEMFEFDAAAVRLASVQQASRAALPPAAKREIVVVGMDVIDELSAADQFDDADTLSERMLTLARPLRDAELIKSLADQRRAFTELAASHKKAQTAFETLKTSPDDAEANLAAGRYLAFVKQDWETGLAHLAKGSDALLAAAAKAELAAPTTPADQEKLADAWWAAADAQKDTTTKNICRAQSVNWYREIIDDLTGLAKVKVEKRISEAGDVASVDRHSPARRRPLTVHYLDDMQESSFVSGKGALGKHGRDHNGNGISFQQMPLSHSLFMYGKKQSSAMATYVLDGQFDTFDAIAGLTNPGDGRTTADSPLTFKVIGDGKELWSSSPIQKLGTGQACKVSIEGVKELTLRVDCPGGSDDGAWAVWINPRIVGFEASSGTAKADLGVFSRDPSELRSPSKAGVVYLDDLQETDSKVGWGSLGKHGNSYHLNRGDYVFEDKVPEHCLSINARGHKEVAYVTYQLDGSYNTFEATAGLWHRPITDPKNEGQYHFEKEANSPIFFRVVGDDKVLWESKPTRAHNVGEKCRVDIKNVRQLKLEVHCPGGYPDGGWGVWAYPRISRSASTAKTDPKKPIKRADLQPRPVMAVASGSNHHTVFVNGQKLLDCGRDKATTAACILKPGDVITVRLGDRFDIKSFWMLVLSDKGEPLFETSENWIGYLPADDARWWDVSTKGLKQEPAQFTGDGREYVDLVQGAAAAALPTLKSKDKAQPIFSPLHGGDNKAFLAYVVTVDDLKPKKASGR